MFSCRREWRLWHIVSALCSLFSHQYKGPRLDSLMCVWGYVQLTILIAFRGMCFHSLILSVQKLSCVVGKCCTIHFWFDFVLCIFVNPEPSPSKVTEWITIGIRTYRQKLCLIRQFCMKTNQPTPCMRFDFEVRRLSWSSSSKLLFDLKVGNCLQGLPLGPVQSLLHQIPHILSLQH